MKPIIDESLLRDRPITRYMSLAKFLDLLKRRRLFFPKVSLFEDPYEGSATMLNGLFDSGMLRALDITANLGMGSIGEKDPEVRKRRKEELDAAWAELKARKLQTVFGDLPVGDDDEYRAVALGQRNWIDVCCWHKEVDESLAMWKIYGGSFESVCIVSTVGCLADSLAVPEHMRLELHPVNYIDYEKHVFSVGHPLAPFIHKRKPYGYEDELRAILYDPSSEITTERKELGTYVDVDLTTLIKELRVSPKAPAWFIELLNIEVKSVLDVPVNGSELDRKLPYCIQQ